MNLSLFPSTEPASKLSVTPLSLIERTSLFSACGIYRYKLERRWRPFGEAGFSKLVVVAMLNPSTAGGETVVRPAGETSPADDATTRKNMGFTRIWDGTDLIQVNMFGYCARDPRRLLEVDDPVGPDNDGHVAELVRRADLVVLAWGDVPSKRLATRAETFTRLVLDASRTRPMCLGRTESGAPRHPLYPPYSTPLVPFEVRG